MVLSDVAPGSAAPRPACSRDTAGALPRLSWHWAVFVVLALLLLDATSRAAWAVAVSVAAAVGAALAHRHRPGAEPARRAVDRDDLVVIGILYVVVVALLRVAFVGFGTDRVAGLFLSFGTALVLGVAVPLWYTVRWRGRSLRSVGLGHDWRAAAVPGLCFASVQLAITLWGYDLPSRAVDWVPLLVMSLMVGAFETVFFRGFAQGCLERSFGTALGIAVAAALYALYHVGYGMGAREMAFLFGLGVVYALAFAVARHGLVLWPLLTPLGALFNNLEAGDIELPWASIAGFADVLVLMAVAVWLAAGQQRRAGGGDERAPAVPAPR